MKSIGLKRISMKRNPDEEDQVASWLSETGGQALAEEQESLRDYGAV